LDDADEDELNVVSRLEPRGCFSLHSFDIFLLRRRRERHAEKSVLTVESLKLWVFDNKFNKSFALRQLHHNVFTHNTPFRHT
jgi:hypothetical protein